MTNKDIGQLINKYLDGETSPVEECQLARELQRTDIPEEWQAVRLMLGELTLGEAEYDAIMAHRSNKSKTAPRLRRLRPWLGAIAASILLLLVFRFGQEPVEEPPVVAETVEQSAPQPAVSEPIIEEKQEEALPEVQPTPQPAKKRRKTVKKQGTPIEKPLLAEAEPITEALAQNNSEERLSDPSNPYLLATTQLQDLRSRGERLDREVAMLMQH